MISAASIFQIFCGKTDGQKQVKTLHCDCRRRG